jgi:hypothetical protein
MSYFNRIESMLTNRHTNFYTHLPPKSSQKVVSELPREVWRSQPRRGAFITFRVKADSAV